MSIFEMPDYAIKHKPLGYAFLCCAASCVMLILQLILMEKNAFSVIFLFLIPAIAAGAFAFHSITMTEDRPAQMFQMPMVFFLSLLIHELIKVEVGAQDTYPFIALAECAPLPFFFFCIGTSRFRKQTRNIMLISAVILVVWAALLSVLAVFFNVRFISSIHYIKGTFALVFGYIGAAFMYFAMWQQLILTGTKCKGVPFLLKRKEQLK